jgi:hypothetical protein
MCKRKNDKITESGMGGGTSIPMILSCHDSVSFLWLRLRRAAFLCASPWSLR